MDFRRDLFGVVCQKNEALTLSDTLSRKLRLKAGYSATELDICSVVDVVLEERILTTEQIMLFLEMALSTTHTQTKEYLISLHERCKAAEKQLTGHKGIRGIHYHVFGTFNTLNLKRRARSKTNNNRFFSARPSLGGVADDVRQSCVLTDDDNETLAMIEQSTSNETPIEQTLSEEHQRSEHQRCEHQCSEHQRCDSIWMYQMPGRCKGPRCSCLCHHLHFRCKCAEEQQSVASFLERATEEEKKERREAVLRNERKARREKQRKQRKETKPKRQKKG